MEIWLKGKGYSDKLVQKQILKLGNFQEPNYLTIKEKNKFKINLPLILRTTLLLTANNEHNKGFRDVPIIGFRRVKSLKDILVRAKTPQIKNKFWCGPCKGPRCEICKHIVSTRNFTSFTTKHTYEIRSENLNCSSKNVVYLISCKTFHEQYTGSSEEFRVRFNNYRCAHRHYCKNMKVKQESFHAHFADGAHIGESDWEVKLIDQSVSTEDLRKRESFWQHELDTFQPNGLNEREVALF